MLLFYVCKRSFNFRYQFHTRRENQSTTGIVLKKVHAQKKIFCIKGLPNVTFYACKMSFNYRYKYHMRRENQSTTGVVLKKVHAQKKIFCIKRIFLHKRAAQCYSFMCARGYSVVGTNITREWKTSQLWTLFWKMFMPKSKFSA